LLLLLLVLRVSQRHWAMAFQRLTITFIVDEFEDQGESVLFVVVYASRSQTDVHAIPHLVVLTTHGVVMPVPFERNARNFCKASVIQHIMEIVSQQYSSVLRVSVHLLATTLTAEGWADLGLGCQTVACGLIRAVNGAVMKVLLSSTDTIGVTH